MVEYAEVIEKKLEGQIPFAYGFFFGEQGLIMECMESPGNWETVRKAIRRAYMYGYYNGHQATIAGDYKEREV